MDCQFFDCIIKCLETHRNLNCSKPLSCRIGSLPKRFLCKIQHTRCLRLMGWCQVAFSSKKLKIFVDILPWKLRSIISAQYDVISYGRNKRSEHIRANAFFSSLQPESIWIVPKMFLIRCLRIDIHDLFPAGLPRTSMTTISTGFTDGNNCFHVDALPQQSFIRNMDNPEALKNIARHIPTLKVIVFCIVHMLRRDPLAEGVGLLLKAKLKMI